MTVETENIPASFAENFPALPHNHVMRIARNASGRGQAAHTPSPTPYSLEE
jgi:hypothetical protein